MKIIISDDVKFAVTDIFNYTLNISSKYARKTVDNIYEIIFNIKDAPYIGRYVPELSDKYFRERIYKEYRIIYYVSEKIKQFIFNIYFVEDKIQIYFLKFIKMNCINF